MLLKMISFLKEIVKQTSGHRFFEMAGLNLAPIVILTKVRIQTRSLAPESQRSVSGSRLSSG